MLEDGQGALVEQLGDVIFALEFSKEHEQISATADDEKRHNIT